MLKKKSVTFKSKLAIGLVFVIAVIYTLYHVSNLLFSQKIITIASGISTQSETVSGRGYIFRDEVLLTSQNKGVVDYQVGDGQSVSTNQQIADVYEGNGVAVRSLMKTVDRQIAVLEKSEVGAEPLDLAALRQDANETYYGLVADINMGNTGQLDSQIEQMMVTLNKISVMTDGEASVSETLASLRQTRESLLSGEYVSEYSAASGYFYYYPDGYEDLFNSDMLSDITDDKFYRLENYYLKGERTVGDDVYGKIAHDSSWRFVISLPDDEAERFAQDGKYRVVFPDNNNTELIMSLERTIESVERAQTICIFFCNRLPSDFKLERVQNAQIDISTIKGIYVPRTALAKEDGINGVYVLRGSVVYFRNVDVIYNGVDYCLVAENAPNEGEYYSLGINELIITNGKNLFHGRVLE